MTIKNIPHVRKYKSTTLYTIYKGKKESYSHDKTMPGVTVKFQDHYSPTTTIVYCDNIKRANEIIEYQEANKVAIHKAQQELGKHISKEYYGN